MTHTASARRALPAILLIILASACRSPILDIAGGATGRLLVAFPTAASVAGSRAGGAGKLSATFGTIDAWTLLGDGPKGAKASIDFTATDASSGTVSVELALGDWSLTMKGFDADGSEVLSADGSVTIEPNADNTSSFAMAWAENALVARLSFDAAIQEDTGRLAATPSGTSWSPSASTSGSPSLDGQSYLAFDGSQYVDLSGIDLGSSFTVSMWVKPTLGSDMNLVSSQDNGSAPGFTLYLKDTGGLGLRTPNKLLDAYSTHVSADRWTLVSAALDTATLTAILYIDGVVVDTGTIDNITTDRSIRIGAFKSLAYPSYYTGSMDDVRIYSGALDAAAIADIYADGYFSGGRGTEASPYLVATPMDLYNVRYFPTAQYRQTADIDLSASAMTSAWTPISELSGSYDGGGRTVSNLVLGNGTTYDGLFQTLSAGATVRNLTLNGVSGSVTAQAGALAGYAKEATITNLTLRNVTLSSSAYRLGGLVGEINNDDASLETTISDVRLYDVSLNGTAQIGGLAGLIGGAGSQAVRISMIAATNVTVRGSESRVGGLAGQTSSSTIISDSSVSGTVESSNASAQHLGGLAGYFFGNATNCTANVTVGPASGTSFTGASNIGGFAGQIQDPAILSDCDATGDVTGGYLAGTTSTGGFAGFITNVSSGALELTRCTASGAVGCDSGYCVGGFSGYISSGSASTTLSDCSASGIVSAPSGMQIGGFAGNINGYLALTTCTATGNVVAGSALSQTVSFGGFAGYAIGNSTTNRASLTSCTATGSVTATGPGMATGGFIGIAASNTTMTGCSASGAVTSDSSSVGGFAGSGSSGASMSGCYASGAVNASYNIGGFIGDIAGTMTVNQCYATGNVSGTSYNLGGFVGWVSGGTIENCYARGDVTAASGSTGVAGFAGMVNYSGPVLSTSYSSGTITNGTGAFIGGTTVSQTYTGGSSCRWHIATAGGLVNPTASASTGLVTGPSGTDMRYGEIFVGWLESVWTFAAGSYPRLAWEP